MPCNGEYLNQTEREAEIQRAAKLALYILDKIGRKVPNFIREQSKKYYADRDDVVPYLCKLLTGLSLASKKEFDRVVYNAKSKTSRDLADWWEAHVAADKKRIQQEKEQKDNEVREAYIKQLRKMPIGKVKKMFGE